MILLFDQNLSHHLVTALGDDYPDSKHVRNVGMKDAPDTEVWNYAKAHGFMIVSKDSDFHQRSLLLGSPPKVIWVRLGNCSTKAVESILRAHIEDVKAFEADEEAAFLILY